MPHSAATPLQNFLLTLKEDFLREKIESFVVDTWKQPAADRHVCVNWFTLGSYSFLEPTVNVIGPVFESLWNQRNPGVLALHFVPHGSSTPIDIQNSLVGELLVTHQKSDETSWVCPFGVVLIVWMEYEDGLMVPMTTEHPPNISEHVTLVPFTGKSNFVGWKMRDVQPNKNPWLLLKSLSTDTRQNICSHLDEDDLPCGVNMRLHQTYDTWFPDLQQVQFPLMKLEEYVNPFFRWILNDTHELAEGVYFCTVRFQWLPFHYRRYDYELLECDVDLNDFIFEHGAGARLEVRQEGGLEVEYDGEMISFRRSNERVTLPHPVIHRMLSSWGTQIYVDEEWPPFVETWVDPVHVSITTDPFVIACQKN